MLKHIDYVYTVYKEKSFTRAAERLYISQPSLSSTIKKLEKELGYPIFERGGKEITPTYIGEKYIKAAEEILCIKNNLENEIDDLLKLHKGKVVLGSTTFIVSNVLPEILKRFNEKYPDIEVKILVEQSTVLQEKLEQGLVDIAIDNATAINPYYEYISLFDEHILLGVPEELAINRKNTGLQLPTEHIVQGICDYGASPKIDVTEFRNEDFILLKSGNKMRQIAGCIFAEKNMTPKVRFEFDQLMTSISFAESGFGVCFLTDTILKYGRTSRNMIFYQPDTCFTDRTLYVMYKKNKYLSSAGGEFIRFLNELKDEGSII